MSKHSLHSLIANIDDMPRKALIGGEDWRIVHGDCLDILPQLPSKSVNLIFADPPYNLQLKKELYRPNMTRVDGVDDAWDKFSSFAEYDSFCEKWLRECQRLLTDDGAMWVIGSYHNIFRVGRLMQDLGFWLQNDVIWHKTNPMPNFRGVRFTNATETLIWAKKHEKSRAVFNHKTMKAENDGKQMTSVWSLPLCGGKERLRDAEGQKMHPTQKPAALLRRVILSTTRTGDVILDPFLGSGTTLAVARELGRVGIGIERENKYINIAKKRIADVVPQTITESELQELQPTPRRVAFAELIARKLIRPGATLQSKDGKTKASVLANGNIKVNGKINAEGSIHRIGARVAGTDSCNGWNFWRVHANGDDVLLNQLREQVRGC